MLNGSFPDFGLSTGQLAVSSARAIALFGLLCLFGTLLLRRQVLAPSSLGTDRSTRRIGLLAAAVAIVGLAGWCALEAFVLSGTTALGSIVEVLTGTVFGHLVLTQFGLTVLASLAFAVRREWPALFASGAAVVLQAGHLHAWAMEPELTPLLLSEAAHLLAAAAWLGGLPGLLAVVRGATPPEAAAVSRRFSGLAMVAVVVLAGSAFWQGWELSGGFPGLLGTAYGWMELLKLALFAAMLVCAAANRSGFTPALSGGQPARAKRALAASIAVETGLGLLVVAAATVLTSLEPGMHAQAVWPFTMQPSLEVVRADEQFRQEVSDAALAMVGACLLVALGIIARRVRWPAITAAAVIAWFALPHFDLLLVEAYPTTFYHSPTGFTAGSISQGATLYAANCVTCHGTEGRGDGPAAHGLRIPPADLTAEHLWGHADGELFWWITHGIVSAEGEVAMPGFGPALSEDDRWALIDYLHAQNAGVNRRATGAWPVQVRAPELSADCPDGRTVTLAALRGHVVRIAFGSVPADLPDVVTIAAPLGNAPAGDAEAGRGACIAGDPDIAHAYAIITGLNENDLKDMQVIVDASGWLRGVFPAGEVAAAISAIAAAPLPEQMAMHHHGG